MKTLLQKEETSYAVATRAQIKQRDLREKSEQKLGTDYKMVTVPKETAIVPVGNETEADTQNTQVGDRVAEDIGDDQIFPFDGSLFIHRETPKIYKTRDEK